MVAFLKFGASWLLPPGIFIILMFVLTYRLTKLNRKLAYFVGAGTFIFYLLCTGIVADCFMGKLEHEYSPPENLEECGADVIVFLGGGAIKDVQDVDGEGGLTSSASSRLLTAVRIQRLLDVPIILSGGQLYSDSGEEAVIAGRILQSLDVPADKILLETKSINTTQNAVYSAEIIREKNFKRPLVVTSAFHMRRAVLNFSRQGLEIIPYPTNFTVPKKSKFHYISLRPQAAALLLNVTVMQEILRTFVTEITGK
ncbi:MAG: YdcF family protein [Selenomonadaceae bacterium]|nr:YdcF family protein [Selenomonadaceae bacterium]